MVTAKIQPIDFEVVAFKLFVPDEKGNIKVKPQYPLHPEINSYLSDNFVTFNFKVEKGDSASFHENIIPFIFLIQFFEHGTCVTFTKDVLAHLGIERVIK